MNQSSQNTDVSMEEEVNLEEDANKIRRIYRNIREKITENRLEFINPNSDAIESTLESVENTFRNVKKPREAVSDSHVLLELAILGKERIRNVHCEFRSFNNSEFMEKMRIFMLGKNKKGKNKSFNHDDDYKEDDEVSDSDEEMNQTQKSRSRSQKFTNQNFVFTKPIISKFGEHVMNYFRIAPRPTFLLGSLEKELKLKQKTVRQKRQNEKTNQEELRTKIKELDPNSKEETSTTVTEIERIFKILKKIYKKLKGRPFCLYQFVINPKSFSRTIENIFYVSFLVKDGFAKIYLDTDNLPVIEPILENEPESFDSNEIAKRKKPNQNNVQCMLSLNKMEWKEIIEVFNIQSTVIPDPK